MKLHKIAILAFALYPLLALPFSGCSRTPPPEAKGRVVIDYWEKWTSFEAAAMQAVVEDFNASQDRIYVRYLPVSQIDRKLLLAIAGGNPPDVAGMWSYALAAYSENNALTPLDRYAAEAGIVKEDYLPIFWELGEHKGHLWALPTTPATNALHWNKKLFREAGLDPEQPPRSLAELEAMNDKLLLRDDKGRIIRLGHNPQEPGWWSASWVSWFGGEPWTAESGVEADSPQMRATFAWLETYPKRFGGHDLQQLRNSFGNFASPQNPFFTGRVAMVLQGPWLYNFIKDYAPEDFEWGVAPFPSADPERFPDVSIAEADQLVIPAGAKHPDEAFEFIKYVQQQAPMEKLCLGQKKFSPLRQVSDAFYAQHPNPYIKVFADLAASPNVSRTPPITIWNEYRSAITNAVDTVMLGDADAAELLPPLQESMSAAYDRALVRWDRVAQQREEAWNEDVRK